MSNKHIVMDDMNDENIVVLKDVKKDYFVKGRNLPIRALRGVTLSIKYGSMIAIKGESGSGKTTLLQMIGALDVPTSGKVRVAGLDLDKMDESELTDHRAKTIGIVFQSYYLIPNLTALENVELAMEALDVPKDERRKRAMELLESVGMKERIDYKPLKMSGGEQQRVAIARALANKPSIILADEPTGNLDTRTGREIIKLLNKLRKEKGTTIIIVTHSDGAAKSCDFTYTIHDGIIASKKDLATEEELRERKNIIRSELAISGKVLSKLFSAEYDTLEKIANASFEDILEITSDKIITRKIVKNARTAYDKELAGKQDMKKMLSMELGVSENIIDKLFEAGIESLGDIDQCDYEMLENIIGDDELTGKISKKAEDMLNSM